MNCRLRTYESNPPGGFPYVQVQDIRHNFPSQPLIEAQAKIVSSFRAANGLPRASVRECLEDIDRFNALRLGCHRMWTVPVGTTAADARVISLQQNHPAISECAGCGATIFSPP